MAETKKWFANTLLNISRRDFAFDIIVNDTVMICAMGGLTDINLQHKHAELYIVVDPKQTGKGIGQKAIQWLCNYGFMEFGLNRIYLFTLENNIGARRLYEKLGFSHEGVLREHIFQHGRMIDRHVQALLKREWKKLSWRQRELVLEIILD